MSQPAYLDKVLPDKKEVIYGEPYTVNVRRYIESCCPKCKSTDTSSMSYDGGSIRWCKGCAASYEANWDTVATTMKPIKKFNMVGGGYW